MAKKKLSEMSYSEILQRNIDRHNRKRAKSLAMFQAEQKRQGKKANEPIDLMKMVMGR